MSGVHTYHIKQHGDHKREGTIGKAPTTNVKKIGYINKKNQNFALNRPDIISHKSPPWETGITKVKGPDRKLKRVSDHKNTNFRVVPKSQVSMYSTQINPLENENYKGGWSISWFGTLPRKFKNSR